MHRRSLWLLIGVAAVASLASGAKDVSPIPWLDYQIFREHVAALASDDFEGRKPGTPGEEKTVEYIRSRPRHDLLPVGAPG